MWIDALADKAVEPAHELGVCLERRVDGCETFDAPLAFHALPLEDRLLQLLNCIIDILQNPRASS